MSEKRYRLEENNQTNELILWEDAKILNVFKSSYDNRKHLNIIVDKLNKQQNIIGEQKIAIDELITDYKNLEKENEQLQKEKEYYREYALQYLLEYDLYTDNFLNDIKDIIGEEGVKRVKEKQNKIIEALKKEGLYE